MGKIKKVVLAYSGGLDTSVIIPWLKENYDNPEIIAVCMNVGQTPELVGIEERAKNAGADKLIVLDLRKEFVEGFIFPTLKAGAKYEGYTLGTPMARPLIAQKLVEVAKAENADAVCHGATGKGNDQVRFELTIMALAPNMKIIAPWREWDLKSRDDEIDYCEKRGIKLKVTRETNYSKDLNIWHLSHEGLELEDPANEPPHNKDGFLEISNSPENAPNEAEYITIGFEKGIPVALNGKKSDGVKLIEDLNKIAGKHGVGTLDIVANRIIGMKARSISEAPAAEVLYRAHEIMESLCLDKTTAHYKGIIAKQYADLVYTGHWFTPLREALDAFVDKTQECVTGEVKLKLYKGNIITAGCTSPYSLHSKDFATFDGDDVFDQVDSSGFLKVYGLPLKIMALLKEKR
ncbi:MAG: argininosuccinate synthase [Clostridiales bacterium]|nr:argininosuccinate synthase [Clostridiales bacterium]